MCDVDESAATKEARVRRKTSLKDFPKATDYKDFRVMLEKQKDIYAVLVATPDHTHAVVAMAAMQLGKHVYVQKPLTRTISEARALTERPGSTGRQPEGTMRSEKCLRLSRRGSRPAPSAVREVHCWPPPYWPQACRGPKEQAVRRASTVISGSVPRRCGVPQDLPRRLAPCRFARRDGRHCFT